MKVTMTTVMCGPEGNAFQGQVLDIPEKRMQTITDPKDKEKTIQVPLGEYLIENKFARPYDQHKDSKKPIGLQKPER